MTQSPNILNELNELNSSLAGNAAQNPYAVPAGYFESLLGEVLNRIRAMESKDSKEELSYLSPVLNDITRQMPYSVPDEYFSSLAENAMRSSQSAKEELESVSPFLSSLKKENPYSVPAGYFENLNMPAEETKNEVRVVSITSRKWFRYAAAAMVIGIMIIGGISLFKKGNPASDATARELVEKKVKNLSTDDIDAFVQLAEKEKNYDLAVISAEKPQEVKDLIKDIPEQDLQNFIKDTEPLTDEDAETSLN